MGFGELGIVVWGEAGWAQPLLGRLAEEAGRRAASFTLLRCAATGMGGELEAALGRFKHVWIVVRPRVDELRLLAEWWPALPPGPQVEVVVAGCGWSDVPRIEEAVRQLPRWPRIWIPPGRAESPAAPGLSLWITGGCGAAARRAAPAPGSEGGRPLPGPSVRRRAPLFQP